ncbi:hypothetical protein AWENTII_003948 [Aspergillus wentii]
MIRPMSTTARISTKKERVINQLQVQNDKRNAEYSMAFAAIPLLSMMVFLQPVLTGSSTLSEQSLAFLSIISLAVTTYTMTHVPLQRPNRKDQRPIYKTSHVSRIRNALLPINSVICVFLVLVYFSTSPVASSSVRPTVYLVPGAMLVIIFIARRVMLSVDIGPLEDLRYEFKGA